MADYRSPYRSTSVKGRIRPFTASPTSTSNNRYWLDSDLTATSDLRAECPQLRTFRQRYPLSRRLRPLHLQVRTFLVVSPFVWC